jgi:putative restriction endonuclease
MARLFGQMAGCPVGATFGSRRELAAAGVHTPLMAGISGNGREGADSIVVSGGYLDDQDYGDVILYTGHGGNDPATKRQVADQQITAPGNAGLVRSQLEGLPVRVIRGAGGDPAYSPPSGFRYDGLFRVEDHWSKLGLAGFRIWQFRLVQLNATPASSELPTPQASGPVARVATTVQRQVRSSAVIEQVKRWYQYRCQLCGGVLAVATGPYAEGAHIRGLGRPHLGPDIPENVLCLCPNDHVRFDNGAVYLLDDLTIVDALEGKKLGRLRLHPKHRIDLTHVRYHRETHAT